MRESIKNIRGQCGKVYTAQQLQSLAEDQEAFETECQQIGNLLQAQVRDGLSLVTGAYRDALLLEFDDDKLLDEARRMLKFWTSSAQRPADVARGSGPFKMRSVTKR